MRWPLTTKFVLGTLFGLLGLSLLFLLLFVSVYKNAIETAHSGAADRVSSLFGITLKQAMLDRELHRLQPIIDGLASADDVLSVRILNPAGQIRFTNVASEFGITYDASKDLGCRECHEKAKPQSTLFFTDTSGRDILRAVLPVRNQKECSACHAPVEQQAINGVLMVDYEGSSIQGQARDVALLFVGAGLVVFFITVLGGTWFMRRFVLKPVSSLHSASKQIIDGNLGARVSIPGSDEFSTLGHCFNDLTSQLQEKLKVLEEKDAFLQGLVDAVPDGLRVIDDSYRILLTNEAYEHQLAIDRGSATGDFCYASSHRRDSPCPATLVRCPAQELMEGGEPVKSIHHHKRADGHMVDVEVYAASMNTTLDGRPQHLVVESIRDLKEQARFSHEQKLSELGQLAAGVAHEIFNPLSAAKMKLDATLAAIQSGRLSEEQVLKALSVVDSEIGRSIETADRLIKLSRYAGDSASLVDVNTAVSETLSLLNDEARHSGINIEQHLSDNPVRALVNDSELRLVVLNLAQNAFHAMDRDGTITVTTAKAEGWIQIIVEDNGPGISEDVLPHIFEPFYSRREHDKDKGAGLGLAISHANIKRYGGNITVWSKVGTGARFTVSLPDPEKNQES